MNRLANFVPSIYYSGTMKRIIPWVALLMLLSLLASVQLDTTLKGTFFKPVPRNYEVKHAIEVESFFPMFFIRGYHVGVCYQYKHFRFRVSVINGGFNDADPAGIPN
jgi:hypothetical protein